MDQVHYSIVSEQQEGPSWTFVVALNDQAVESDISKKLSEIGAKANLPGFRRGKIPHSVLAMRWGEQARIETIQELAGKASDALLLEKTLRVADQPDIVNITGIKDGSVSFTLRVNAFPEFKLETINDLVIERYDPTVKEENIESSLKELAESQQRTQDLTKERPTQENDTLKINFVGKIDGKEFKGGKADDVTIVLGSGQFLPEFEQQLLGKKAKDKTVVNLTFPENYHEKSLAAKEAKFDVEIIEHLEPKPSKIDEDLAKELGMKSLEELRTKVKESLENRFIELEKQIARRRALDILDKGYTFDLPQSMVEREFDAIWKHLEEAKKNNTLSEDEKKKDEKTLRKEFQEISERRVKLGLLLSAYSQEHKIEVTDEEVSRAIAQEAQRYRGNEQKFYEHHAKNKELRERFRAPILEEKAMSSILDKMQATRKSIDFDDLVALHKKVNEEEETQEKPKKRSKSKQVDTAS